MEADRERAALWAAYLAALREPRAYLSGLSEEDEQALRDISGRVRRILTHDAVLPAGLAAMLREYLAELEDMAGGRWEGIGDPARRAYLARSIAQDITDGEWAPGSRVYLDAGGRAPWYFTGERRETIRRAMQLLAARGDVEVRQDGYYVRPR